MIVTLGTSSESFASSGSGACHSPKAAITTLLNWLQPENYEPRVAATCILKEGSISEEIAAQRAAQIIQVLDAKGLFIQVDSLPGDFEYKNVKGEGKYVLSPLLPQVFVEMVGEQWVWGRRTIHDIPALHQKILIFDMTKWNHWLPPWVQNHFMGFALWQWSGLLLLLLGIFMVRFITLRFIFGQAKFIMTKLKFSFSEEILERGARPLGMFLGLSLFIYVLPGLGFTVRFNQVVLSVARLLLAFYGILALYRFTDLVTGWLTERASSTETKLDDQFVPLIDRALKNFILCVGGVFILQNLNYDVDSLIATLGVGSLAVALAAQNTIANLFGSATIFAGRPFQIGDWVKAVGVEGVVESVGFRSTQIRTFYNSLITIPNSKVADSAIDNLGARQYRRYSATLGLTYDTSAEQIQAFVEGVRAIFQANSAVRQDYYEVHFKGFGDFALEIMVYCFFEVSSWTDELKARHQVLIEIKRLGAELGVEFAFPTQTLHLSREEGTVATNKDLDSLKASVEAFGPHGSLSQPQGPKLTHGFLPNN